jgi:hypothetical protein
VGWFSVGTGTKKCGSGRRSKVSCWLTTKAAGSSILDLHKKEKKDEMV